MLSHLCKTFFKAHDVILYISHNSLKRVQMDVQWKKTWKASSGSKKGDPRKALMKAADL